MSTVVKEVSRYKYYNFKILQKHSKCFSHKKGLVTLYLKGCDEDWNDTCLSAVISVSQSSMSFSMQSSLSEMSLL